MERKAIIRQTTLPTSWRFYYTHPLKTSTRLLPFFSGLFDPFYQLKLVDSVVSLPAFRACKALLDKIRWPILLTRTLQKRILVYRITFQSLINAFYQLNSVDGTVALPISNACIALLNKVRRPFYQHAPSKNEFSFSGLLSRVSFNASSS